MRHAIEHAGKKIAGIHEIEIHSHEIQADYDGNGDALYRFVEIVEKLGYDASM